MQLRRLVVVAVVAGALGCGFRSQTISEINGRPDKFYDHKVEFTGRITRTQLLPDVTLLEVVDPRGARIIVRSPEAPEPGIDDWVRVTGVLVPESKVGDATLYDVVVLDSLKKVRPPRFMNVF